MSDLLERLQDWQHLTKSNFPTLGVHAVLRDAAVEIARLRTLLGCCVYCGAPYDDEGGALHEAGCVELVDDDRASERIV